MCTSLVITGYFLNEIFLLHSCLKSTHLLDFYIHFDINMKYNFF